MHSHSTHRAGGRSGFSLLEITLALMFLTIAGGAVMSAIVTNMMTSRVNRETATAHEAARAQLERRLRAEPGAPPSRSSRWRSSRPR